MFLFILLFLCLLLNEISLAAKLFLDVLEGGDFFFCFFDVELAGVVGIELGQGVAGLVTFLEELVVVEAAVVGGHAVEVAQVDSLGALLVGQQRLVELFAVADADDLDVLLAASEELADGLGLRGDGAGGSLLHQDVAVLAVLEGEEHQVDGLVQAHDEAGHRRLGHGDGIARTNLLDPQRNHRPARTHHVAIARAANLGLARVAALGHGHLLLDGLGDTHGVDGIGRLVGRQTYHGPDTGLDGGGEDVVSADNVGLDGLHGEEFARRHLLEGGGVEDIVDARHHVAARLQVAHVADVELDLVGHLGIPRLILMAHIVLLLLVARKNANLTDIRV